MNSNVIIYTLSLLLIPFALLRQHYIYRKGIQQITIHWTSNLVIAFILTVLVRGLAYDTGADWLAYPIIGRNIQNGFLRKLLRPCALWDYGIVPFLFWSRL